MVFEGPGPPILRHFPHLFRDSLPELTFSRFLSILGSPGHPLWSSWALFSTLFFQRYFWTSKWCENGAKMGPIFSGPSTKIVPYSPSRTLPLSLPVETRGTGKRRKEWWRKCKSRPHMQPSVKTCGQSVSGYKVLFPDFRSSNEKWDPWSVGKSWKYQPKSIQNPHKITQKWSQNPSKSGPWDPLGAQGTP